MDKRDTIITLQKGKLLEIELLHDLYSSKELYGFADFDELCKAPIISGGLGINPKTVKKYIELWEALHIKLKVGKERMASIGTSKLFKILPHINEDNADDLLNKAESLSPKDLGLSIAGVEPETCPHEWEPWKRCVVCKVFGRGKINELPEL